MAMMTAVVSSLSAFFHDRLDIQDYEDRMVTARRLIAKMPTIAAACYKHSIGDPSIYPRDDLSYTGNLLYMMFSLPGKRYEVDPVAERALDVLFTLHADHEQLCTPTTNRMRLRPRCGWPGLLARILTRRSRPVSRVYGVRRTVAPMRR